MQGDEILLDSEVRQQRACVPRVLGRDALHVAQRLQRTGRDVIQVADRCGDDVKRAGCVVFHATSLPFIGARHPVIGQSRKFHQDFTVACVCCADGETQDITNHGNHTRSR